jgi:hypothetical protein
VLRKYRSKPSRSARRLTPPTPRGSIYGAAHRPGTTDPPPKRCSQGLDFHRSSIGEETRGLELAPARSMRATAPRCLLTGTSHAIGKQLRDRSAGQRPTRVHPKAQLRGDRHPRLSADDAQGPDIGATSATVGLGLSRPALVPPQVRVDGGRSRGPICPSGSSRSDGSLDVAGMTASDHSGNPSPGLSAGSWALRVEGVSMRNIHRDSAIDVLWWSLMSFRPEDLSVEGVEATRSMVGRSGGRHGPLAQRQVLWIARGAQADASWTAMSRTARAVRRRLP